MAGRFPFAHSVTTNAIEHGIGLGIGVLFQAHARKALVGMAAVTLAYVAAGTVLSHRFGWPLTEPWIAASLVLYVLTGLFWLPVVWIQIELRNLAALAASNQDSLPERYFKLYRIWFACGFPAFAAVLTIVWLMISKPTF